MTSEKYHWALRPFCYLFNLFVSADQRVVVATDTIPTFDLPANFEVHSISNGFPLPKEQWSDGLIEAISHISTPYVLLLLEDYWLTRYVDIGAIPTLTQFCEIHPEIIRMDLTTDRQFNGHAKDAGPWGHYDLVETGPDAEYQMSLQAGIWNRDHLLSILRPGLSPWEVELHLSPALCERKDLRVFGTKQCPVRYINVSMNGKENQHQNLDKLPLEQLTYIREKGWLPK